MSKPPKKIRVIGKDYKVTPDKSMEDFGTCEHGRQKIKYNPAQCKQQLKDTVLHEVIHAVEYGMQIELDERQVHAVSSGILAVLMDNPEFTEWLTNE